MAARKARRSVGAPDKNRRWGTVGCLGSSGVFIVATVAIGDVHGNCEALSDLLSRLRPALDDGDTVVFLGDYIDRGPDTKGCIDSILLFQRTVPAQVVTLMGNHEDWLLQTLRDFRRHSWLLGMEAFETIASYSQEAASALRSEAEAAGLRLITEKVALPYDIFLNVLPADHLSFLEGLKLFHRTVDGLFVHGGLDPDAGEVETQTGEALIWGTESFLTSYRGPEIVVYGHWNNALVGNNGLPIPVIGPASVGIDTISHGVLTAFRLPDRRVLQSGPFAS
jgi:serine/threonine protein phosphatase 1